MPGVTARPAAAPAPPKAAARKPSRPPATFLGLFLVVAALNVVGLVMVLSASSVQSLTETGSTWSYFLKEVSWVAVGGVALLTALRIDYRRWRKLAPLLLAASVLLLLVVLVPQIGLRVNGARSWLGFGSLRLQPAELAKLALLLFLADLLTRRSHRLHEHRMALRPALLASAFVVALVMFQPDLGTTMVLGSIVLSVLFVAGIPLLPLTGVTILGGAGALGLAMWAPYRRARLLAFLHPSADPSSTGYHINQSLTGVASGQLTGVGLGESRAKYGFLPNAHTDFIFAILSEELGLLGALAVVALFVTFAWLGTRAALRAPDRFGTLVAAGITAWITAQALVNVGGVVGLLPITGLTLPFVSFGGTSLAVCMAATGILLNIARQGRR